MKSPLVECRRLVGVCLLFSFINISHAQLRVEALKANFQPCPVGLTEAPQLSWELVSAKRGVVQTAYRLLVATTPDRLSAGRADVWDSGVQRSDAQNYITPAAPLESGRRYYWRVQVRTNRGTAWSDAAWWQMGIDPSEWRAQWIGRSYDTDYLGTSADRHSRVRARYLRKEFQTHGTVERATLYVSGLGLYKAYVNGQRVGHSELAPGPTSYDVRVFYNAYDVTPQLRQSGAPARQAIGVVLGTGRHTAWLHPGASKHYGFPKLTAQLHIAYADGTADTIQTDTTWRITADGPIGNNSEIDGEDYDARRQLSGWSEPAFDDSAWQQAEVQPAPGGRLQLQPNPGIRVMDTVRPVGLSQLNDSVYILDMGQNMVGWMRVRVRGQRGQRLQMRFAETLRPDGSLYTDNLRQARATDTYICRGDTAETWRPSFTYHGFRYVELTGFGSAPQLADFTGEVLYDDMATTGSIETSHPLFNQILKNAYWGIRGNYRGIPTDCPQRDERQGWLGDRGVGAYGESYLFDNHQLYAKWIDDIAADQTPEGRVPVVSPVMWVMYYDEVTWASAWLTVADMVWRRFGDAAPIRKNYDGMKRWMLYTKAQYMHDGIIHKDQYGDWCVPPERPELIHSEDPARRTDGAPVSTPYYYNDCLLMAHFATLAGRPDDVALWNDLAAEVRAAYNVHFLDTAQGCYANNTVTANLLPLRFGMVPEQHRDAVFRHIVEKTEGDCQGHISTGLIGCQQLMRGLTDNGRGDLAWTIATQADYPSWGYMVKQGATTIWELWNGNTAAPQMNSGNHVMLLGDLLVWAYEYLAGIANADGSVACKELKLKPRLVEGLDSVAATYHSLYGNVRSSWQRADGRFAWQFTIPCNTRATVYVPCASASPSAAELKAIRRQGGTFLPHRSGNGYAAFRFPSGAYQVKLRR